MSGFANACYRAPAVSSDNNQKYWRANLRLILSLLSIWFIVSYGGGILFVDFFNQFRLGGYPLGFWIAQQGAIYLFVALIFIYARAMNSLDKRHPEE